MARTYKRDANGRFAGGGGSNRSGRPAAKPVSRGRNRITRDNAGRIASVGGEGATARGGRLRTAAGNKRAVQTARIKGAGGKLRKPVGGGKGARAGKVPKLQFDAAANSRRLARATTRIDKAFDAQNTFMVNKLARARGSYMKIQGAAKGDAAKAKDIYLREPRYSTVKNPKSSLTPKSKSQGKAASRTQGGKPAQGRVASRGKTLPHSEAMARRTEAMLKRGIQTGAKAQNYLRDRGALQSPVGSKAWSAEGRAGRVSWANRNRLAQIQMGRVNAARKERRNGFS